MSLFAAARRAFLSPAWPKVLLGLFAVWFALWAVHPPHPQDFVLEHVLTLLFVILLCWSYRRFRLSNVSYTAIFAFMALHVVGAHYTYSEVPYREWWAALTGAPLPDPEDTDARNHFDRAVHFLYGLLFTRPYREAFFFALKPRRDFWSHLVVLTFIMATSLFYEILEWAAAVLYGGEAGMAFLGTQGDPWDAHKDMLLAAIGGLLGCAGMILRLIVTGEDPARAWGEGRAKEGGS
jgi:putative membrane protein